nr:MAG TPA: tail completion protein [Caudoviricetes sp.]
MTYTDAVQVIRDAITAATGIPTARVLQPGFTDGPLPLAHVSLIQTQPGDYDRDDTISISIYAKTPASPDETGASALADQIEGAFDVRPVVGASGWVDAAEIDSCLGVQPYFEAVEVVHMTATVTHRPISE